MNTDITEGTPKPARIDNSELLASTGLRVIHIRSKGQHPVTVAYRQPHRGHVIEIATAVCNPLDTFSRKIGTKTAVENFLAGRTINIPSINSLLSPVQELQWRFSAA